MSRDHSEDPKSRSANSSESPSEGLSRRSLMKMGALAGAGATLAGSVLSGGETAEAQDVLPVGADFELKDATIAELRSLILSGDLKSLGLTRRYLRRIEAIDRRLGLNSIITINPDAEDIARQLDRDRRNGIIRGPLHGIPVILKDNIDTGDRQMTTAGSFALVGDPALQDSTVAARLRAAGAVIIGKAGLSEWANFRGFNSSSGWSGYGGQVRNPYVLDRNPCGSSSGTGAAVSASLVAAGLATETDGSIVCPASACGVVGIKPSVGLTSRAGVVPISATQDSVGPHGRTVADAAALLGPLTGVDPRDPATAASDGNSFTDYTQFADPDGLRGARIGIGRQFTLFSDETDEVFEEAVRALADGGAEIVDPVDMVNFDEFNNDISEIVVLVWEFKRDLNAYLATRSGVPVSSLADCIAFNQANFDAELKYFGQQWMEAAELEFFTEAQYQVALEMGPRVAGPEGLDATLDAFGLDAIVAPTNSPAWPTDLVNGDCFLGGTSSYAAVAGYPLVTVPMGSPFGLPVGLTFMGRQWSEPTLIRLAAGFEHVTQARISPTFKLTLPVDGSTPKSRRSTSSIDRQQMIEMLTTPRGLRRPYYL